MSTVLSGWVANGGSLHWVPVHDDFSTEVFQKRDGFEIWETTFTVTLLQIYYRVWPAFGMVTGLGLVPRRSAGTPRTAARARGL